MTYQRRIRLRKLIKKLVDWDGFDDDLAGSPMKEAMMAKKYQKGMRKAWQKDAKMDAKIDFWELFLQCFFRAHFGIDFGIALEQFCSDIRADRN